MNMDINFIEVIMTDIDVGKCLHVLCFQSIHVTHVVVDTRV